MTAPAQAGGRREEILRIAAQLIAEEGFDQATMRLIAKAAGIQPASLYYHFATKEDILDEVIRGFLADLPGRYRAIIAAGNPARRTLHDLIALGFRASLANATVMAIIIHERKLFARHDRFAYVADTMRAIERLWLGVLEQGVAAGEFRRGLNLPLVLRMILDLAGSAIEWYRPNNRRHALDAIIDAQLDFIFHGITDLK